DDHGDPKHLPRERRWRSRLVSSPFHATAYLTQGKYRMQDSLGLRTTQIRVPTGTFPECAVLSTSVWRRGISCRRAPTRRVPSGVRWQTVRHEPQPLFLRMKDWGLLQSSDSPTRWA